MGETTVDRADGLRARRELACLSQRQLARLLGCTNTYISHVENGRKTPSSEFVARWEQLLSVHAGQPVVVSKPDNGHLLEYADREYEDFGVELRRRRVAEGWSLRAFAERLGIHPGSLSNIERGVRRPSLGVAQMCDRKLGAQGKLLKLFVGSYGQPGTSLVVGVDVDGMSWQAVLSRRRLVAAGLAAGVSMRLGQPRQREEEDPAVYAQRYDRLRKISQEQAPGPVTLLFLDNTSKLVNMARYGNERTRPVWWRVAAHYAIYLGKLHQESGRTAEADHWTGEAGEWAKLADAPELEVTILTRRAMLAFYQGKARETVELAQAAQRISAAPARLKGLASLREALGHARLHDYDSCMRALDQGQELLDHGDTPPEGLAALEASDLVSPVAMTTAWCFSEFATRIDAAVELFDAELSRTPVAAQRTHARFGVRQARAYVRLGELDHACELTWQLLPLVEETAAVTIMDDLRQLKHALDRHRHHAPAQTAAMDINAVIANTIRRVR